MFTFYILTKAVIEKSSVKQFSPQKIHQHKKHCLLKLGVSCTKTMIFILYVTVHWELSFYCQTEIKLQVPLKL